MCKTFFILCFFLLNTILSNAQENNINKLLKELKHDTPDSTRLRVYTKLSAAYTTVNPEKKFYYASKYKVLAFKMGIDTLVVHGYLDMGVSHGIRNQTDSALFYFAKGYRLAKESNYKSGMARALGSIGYAYDRLDNKEGAIKNTLQSLELFKEVNNKKGMSQSYVNLGSLYYDIAQYRLAESYFKLGLEKFIEANDKRGIAHGYFTLGNTYKELGQYIKAKEHYFKSIELSKAIDNPSELALATWGLGQIDAIEKKYNDALANFQKALKINREIKNEYHKDAVLISMADAYINLKDYKSASTHAMEVYNNAKKTNYLVVLNKVLPLLIAIHKDNHDFEKALEYQTELMTVLDRIASEKTTNNIVLTDFNRIRSENDNLIKNNTKIVAKNISYEKVILITSLLLIIVIFLLGLYYKRNKQKKALNKLLQAQKEEIANFNKELEFLNKEIIGQNNELEQLNKVKNKFFSIVSHDLRSPIANLKMLFGLYRKGQLSEAELAELLSRLENTIYTTAVFLDNLLEWSKTQLEGMVVNPVHFDVGKLVEQNIQLLGSQIKIKELKVENHILEPTVVFADLNMINVVIRNLISNAVKFCHLNDSIIVKTEIKERKISLCISDTGPGIAERDVEKLFILEHTVTSSSAGEKGHQLGLVLCKDMIEQNNGSINVTSKLGLGTTFCIDLPVN